jgi:hypothetical protein
MDLDASSARYVAKITGEVTRGDYKSSDALDVMLSGVVADDRQMCARYVEWSEVMPGKRMIRFSPGLRELYLGGVPELSDQEVVDLDQGGDTIGELDRLDYLGLLVGTKSRPMPSAPRFLAQVEDTGTHPLLRPVAPVVPSVALDLATKVGKSRGLSQGSTTVPLVLAPVWLRQAEHARLTGGRERPWERSPMVLELLERCAAVERPELLPL